MIMGLQQLIAKSGRLSGQLGVKVVFLFLIIHIFGEVALASVCASVKLQIDQEATFERQGFEARMNISNPGAVSLQNLSVTVNFADKDRNTVIATSDPNNTTAKFFIKLSSHLAVPTSVAAGGTEMLRWLIVPAISAGGTEPTGSLYYVGAKLGYTLNGVQTDIDVSPDTIRVQPMPSLTLDYFLPKDVYGDDPFTPELEEPIPFSLGVRVMNSGSGTARNLKIESGQPRIIDNVQGLAVRFRIQGSEVNGAAGSTSLLADFGDVLPNRSGVARWSMTSSLYGRFTDFTASFSHDDGLGGQLTSLITEVRTHDLVHDVLVDLPGRDNVRDFLALDQGGYTIYESENSDASVVDLSERATIIATGRSFTARARLVDSEGMPLEVVGPSYFKVTDPLRGEKELFSVTRADGRVLSENNAWLSSTYHADSEEWEYSLNIFDTNNSNGLAYTVLLGSPTGINHPPVLQPTVPLFTQAGRALAVPIFGADPDGDDVTITAGNLPSGAVFTSTGPGVGRLTWTPSAGQIGIHSIEFVISDGELSDRKTLMLGVLPPGGEWESWHSFFWPGVTDPSIIGPDADPDGDGFANLVEYMLGMDPTSGSLIGQPQVTTVMVDGHPYLAILFTRRLDANYKVDGLSTNQLAGDPSAWQICRNLIPRDQSNVASGFERVLVRDNVPMDGGDRARFMRLRIAGAGEYPNHAPMVLAIAPQVFPTGMPFSVDVSATDPDGDFLSLSATGLPTGAEFANSGSGKGRLSWTPTAGQAGSYTVQISADDGDLADQKPMNLSITAGSLFTAWQGAYWPGVNDPSIISIDADPDSDGFKNILEFALGMNPASGYLYGQPLVSTIEDGGKSYLALQFIGRVNDPSLSLVVEASSDLAGLLSNWQVQTTRIPQSQEGVPSGFERVMVRDSVPIGEGVASRFMRLKVNGVEP